MDGYAFEPDIAIDAPLSVSRFRSTPAESGLAAALALEVIRATAPSTVASDVIWPDHCIPQLSLAL